MATRTARELRGALGISGLGLEELRVLQELTSELAGQVEPNAVARLVLERSVHALGARSGSICLPSEAGGDFVISAHTGYPAEVLERWEHFEVSLSTPVGDCLREKAPIYLSDLEELSARYPVFTGGPLVGDESLAVLPLVVRAEEVCGALVLGFRDPRRFTATERALLSAIARQSAAALERTTSLTALVAATRAAQLHGEQLAFLAEASAMLSRSLELETVRRTIAVLAVPRIADRCLLYLLDGDAASQPMLAPEPTREEQELLVELGPLPAGIATVLSEGTPIHLTRVELDPMASELNAKLVRVGLGGVLVLPLFASGRQLGVLAFVNRADRTLEAADRLLAEELTARAALALDNARLFEVEAAIAHRLSRSLLPAKLPEIDGLVLEARYRPGGSGVEVGGDFYDCVPAGRDAWLIVVGDVQGRGIEAAALTGLARYTIQSYLVVDRRPSALLAHLNGALIRRAAFGFDVAELELDRPRFCTAVLALVERERERFKVTVSTGGHPLALKRTLEGDTEAIGSYGMMLGCSEDARYEDTTIALERGEMLAWVTDGVTERRVGGELFGIEGVSDVLGRLGGRGAAAVADELANAQSSSDGPVDDVVVMVAAAS